MTKSLELDLETIDFEINDCKDKASMYVNEIRRLKGIKNKVERELLDTKDEPIKTYTELEEFYKSIVEDHDDKNKDIYRMLVRLDRILSSMDYELDSISHTVLYDELYKANSYITYEIFDELVRFLLINNIIKPYKALICETCNTVIASFRYKPTQDELSDYLYEQYFCNTCKNEIDYNIPKSELVDINIYSVSKKGDK